MNIRLVRSFALLVAIAAPAFAEAPAVGSQAPAFTLKTPLGALVSLPELTAGHPTVLVFLRGYPGYQCPYCTKQVHDFAANAEKFSAAHTHVLLVYPGPPADLDQRAKEFLALQQSELPANIHLVTDPDYTVTRLYELRWDAPHETAYPSTFVLNKGGTVSWEKISHSHGDRTSATDVLLHLKGQ